MFPSNFFSFLKIVDKLFRILLLFLYFDRDSSWIAVYYVRNLWHSFGRENNYFSNPFNRLIENS